MAKKSYSVKALSVDHPKEREDVMLAARRRILKRTSKVVILEPKFFREWIRQRQMRDIDQDDEVWEGVYVVAPVRTLAQQELIAALSVILSKTAPPDDHPQIFAGANVSDRRVGWDWNFRCPDIVVVLQNSRAVDCNTHWLGGPDFVIEIERPGDEMEQKLSFYRKIHVRELLVIHRETRELRLYRHDGLVEQTRYQGGKWLVSSVLPLAFRRIATRRGARTEVRRTDGEPGRWTV
jgi:Uma2 family endonuclease